MGWRYHERTLPISLALSLLRRVHFPHSTKKTISPAIRAEISFAIREKISNELALNAFSLLTIRKKHV